MRVASGFVPRRRHCGRSEAIRPMRKIKPSELVNICVFVALFSATALQAQAQTVSITPATNPSNIALMGDSVTFVAGIVSSSAYSGGWLKITLPKGFRLLPTNIIPGTLSEDRRSGKMAAPLEASTTLNLTFYVQALCDANTAVQDNDRLITYEFYAASSAETPAATQKTAPILSFSEPILSTVYSEGATVDLNTPVTHVIAITQTASNAHVNNLRIEAAVADKSAVVVSKLEVSKTGNDGDWTDVTASGLDLTQGGKYVYNITRANTFAPLSYAGGQMQSGATLYLRETVSLTKCAGGSTSYSISYGDGDGFCPPLAAAAGAVLLSARTPEFGAPTISSSIIKNPTSPTDNGIQQVRVNNTATDPAAILRNLQIYSYRDGGGRYDFKRSYLCNSNGDPVHANGSTDTIWLGTSGWQRNFTTLNSPDAAMQAAYKSAGLIDADNDGIYNDLAVEGSVCIRTLWNINLNHLSTSSCNQSYLLSGANSYSFGDYSWCGGYKIIGSSVNNWISGVSVSGISNSQITSKKDNTNKLYKDDTATFSFSRAVGTGDFICCQHGAGGTSTWYMEITLPAGFDLNTAAQHPVALGDKNYTMGDVEYTNNTVKIRVWDNQTAVKISVVANGKDDPIGAYAISNTFDYGNTGVFRRFGCHASSVAYVLLQDCDDIEIKDFGVERTSFGYTNISKTARMTKAGGANTRVISPFDDVSLSAQMVVLGNGYAIGSNDTLKASASHKAAFLTKNGRTSGGVLQLFGGAPKSMSKEIAIPPASIEEHKSRGRD